MRHYQYPKPIKFIRYVADKARCDIATDAQVEIALDWIREQIETEIQRQNDMYEREEAQQQGEE